MVERQVGGEDGLVGSLGLAGPSSLVGPGLAGLEFVGEVELGGGRLVGSWAGRGRAGGEPWVRWASDWWSPGLVGLSLLGSRLVGSPVGGEAGLGVAGLWGASD